MSKGIKSLPQFRLFCLYALKPPFFNRRSASVPAQVLPGKTHPQGETGHQSGREDDYEHKNQSTCHAA